jgi:hypothetical protein
MQAAADGGQLARRANAAKGAQADPSATQLSEGFTKGVFSFGCGRPELVLAGTRESLARGPGGGEGPTPRPLGLGGLLDATAAAL